MESPSESDNEDRSDETTLITIITPEGERIQVLLKHPKRKLNFQTIISKACESANMEQIGPLEEANSQDGFEIQQIILSEDEDDSNIPNKQNDPNVKAKIEEVDNYPDGNFPSPILVYNKKGKPYYNIYQDDLARLEDKRQLNDTIIDFYLFYFFNNILLPEKKERSHIFSSIFYLSLTNELKVLRRKEISSKDYQKAHDRLAKWTKSIDIFSKDFIIVPVCKYRHWLAIIICFLNNVKDDIKMEVDCNIAQSSSTSSKPKSTEENTPILETSNQDSANKTKKPCILVFDSLSSLSVASTVHDEIVDPLREYLNIAYSRKYGENQCRFTKENLKQIKVAAPTQENEFDCGLFVLQYIEEFLKNPIESYEEPIDLKNWFPLSKIQNKRSELKYIIVSEQKQ